MMTLMQIRTAVKTMTLRVMEAVRNCKYEITSKLDKEGEPESQYARVHQAKAQS